MLFWSLITRKIAVIIQCNWNRISLIKAEHLYSSRPVHFIRYTMLHFIWWGRSCKIISPPHQHVVSCLCWNGFQFMDTYAAVNCYFFKKCCNISFSLVWRSLAGKILCQFYAYNRQNHCLGKGAHCKKKKSHLFCSTRLFIYLESL